VSTPPDRTEPLARASGFVHDLLTVARRALRIARRDPEAIIPPLLIGAFFFAVNVGSLQAITERIGVSFDYKAFQLPTAVVFAVTGTTRAYAVVTDIQNGYFDKLVLAPVRRSALLLGHMAADFVLIMALTVPVVIVALAIGVRFETGVIGIVAFILMSGLWGLAYAGIPYSIALKTGNPTAVNQSFLIFFPFAFLTTALVPRDALTGWLDSVAAVNPVTYVFEGMRSLVLEGWEAGPLLRAAAAIVGLGVVCHAMAFTALRGRVR
jgi:ABC-2 type transport system permease protein